MLAWRRGPALENVRARQPTGVGEDEKELRKEERERDFVQGRRQTTYVAAERDGQVGRSERN